MTAKQIQALGFTTDAWTTLENVCKLIGIESDDRLYIQPEANQFYFDTTDNLLFVRYTDGLSLYSGTLPNGYARISVNGVDYITKIAKTNANDSTVGKYHLAVDFKRIVGFYK